VWCWFLRSRFCDSLISSAWFLLRSDGGSLSLGFQRVVDPVIGLARELALGGFPFLSLDFPVSEGSSTTIQASLHYAASLLRGSAQTASCGVPFYLVVNRRLGESVRESSTSAVSLLGDPRLGACALRVLLTRFFLFFRLFSFYPCSPVF